MMQQQHADHPAQAGHVLGAGLAVGGEIQQRTAGGGMAAIVASAVAEHAPRPVFGIQPIARRRVDGGAVAVTVPGETDAQRFEQIAFEPPQRPRERQLQPEPRAGFAVDRVEDAGAVVARRQPQHQFVEIEAGQHHIAVQTRRFVDGFRRRQLRQLAALHAVEADVLQRLQRGAQLLFLRPMHAARDQTHTAMLVGEHFHQQAGLAPGAGVEDESGLGGVAHHQLR